MLVKQQSGLHSPKLSEKLSELLPKRSQLYCLTPIGVGTSYGECLTSYVARLAAAHFVTTGMLIKEEILPLFDKPYLMNSTTRTTITKASRGLNGTLTWAQDWSQICNQLTSRNDLHFLTMLPWAGVLSVRGLLRRNLAWCPECYQEWRKTGKNVYTTLLWQLESVTLCPQHRCKLHTHCPICERTISTLSRFTRAGYCSYCGCWLGSSSHPTKAIKRNTDALEWEFWKANAVGDLLSVMPNQSSRPHRKIFAGNVSFLVDTLTQGNMTHLARKLGVTRHSIRDWQLGKQAPRLDTLLQLCYRLSISPLAIYPQHHHSPQSRKQNTRMEATASSKSSSPDI